MSTTSPLRIEPELISLIRNWTVGELSPIAACAGVLVQFLATHPH